MNQHSATVAVTCRWCQRELGTQPSGTVVRCGRCRALTIADGDPEFVLVDGGHCPGCRRWRDRLLSVPGFRELGCPDCLQASLESWDTTKGGAYAEQAGV